MVFLMPGIELERNREVQRGNRFLGEETGGGGKMIISVLDALFFS